MLLIRCPYCEEERPELEFRNAGEAHVVRAANFAEISDDDFEKFFFIRGNQKGIVNERWRHVHGCGRFFNAIRDSITDKFVTVYKAGEPKPNVKLPEKKSLDDGIGDKPADAGPGSWANLPPDQINVKKPATKRAPAKKKGDAQ